MCVVWWLVNPKWLLHVQRRYWWRSFFFACLMAVIDKTVLCVQMKHILIELLHNNEQQLVWWYFQWKQLHMFQPGMRTILCVCVCVMRCGCWNWGKFVKFWRKFQEIIDKFGRIASKIDKISENIQKFSSFPIIQKTSKNSIIFSKENYCQSTYSFTQFFAEISVGLKECIMSIADGTSMPEIVQKYPPWEKKNAQTQAKSNKIGE